MNAETDLDTLSAGNGNYSDLRTDIENGGGLTKSYYRYYEGDGDTIEIRESMVINGNGAVIDMAGLTQEQITEKVREDLTLIDEETARRNKIEEDYYNARQDIISGRKQTRRRSQ